MYNPINGWTVACIKEQIAARNNGNKSTKNLGCAYRGNDNNTCVIGCFIPDVVYENTMEERTVRELLEDFPNLEQYMPLPPSALRLLQVVHDGHRTDSSKTLHQMLFKWIDENVRDK